MDIIALLTLAFLLALTHHCQPNNQIPDFWSSTAAFELQANQSSSLALSYETYNITLGRRYDRSSNLQYAFALKEMVTVGGVSYFDLLVLKTFQSSIVVNFIYEPNKWARVAYHYWVSFRSDLYIGILSFTQQSISRVEDSYRIAVIIRDQNHSKSDIALLFLNGLRTHSDNASQEQGLHFSILSQAVIEGELVFTFTSSPLSSLTFSYIIFSPREIPLTSYGGTISETHLSSSKSRDLRYLLPQSNSHHIYGVSSIQTNKTLSFAAHIHPDFTLTYASVPLSSPQHIEITYLIIGNPPAQLCLKNPQCRKAGEVYILGGQCVKGCPDSARPLEYIDGAVQCIPCPINMQYSSAQKTCVCLPGFLKEDKGCIQRKQLPKGVTNAHTNPEESLTSDDESKPCLSVVEVRQNNKNVFITLQGESQIKSANIRLQFNHTAEPNSYYCNREKDRKEYSCLLLYSFGVPKQELELVAVEGMEKKVVCKRNLKIKIK